MKHNYFLIIVLVIWANLLSAQRIISGVVSDELGTPLIGVNVVSNVDNAIGLCT